VLDPLDGSLLWRERGNLGPQQGERLQLVGGEVLELAGVSFELTCRVIDKTWASWSLLLSPTACCSSQASTASLRYRMCVACTAEPRNPEKVGYAMLWLERRRRTGFLALGARATSPGEAIGA
jgi:hypothetical protein